MHTRALIVVEGAVPLNGRTSDPAERYHTFAMLSGGLLLGMHAAAAP